MLCDYHLSLIDLRLSVVPGQDCKTLVFWLMHVCGQGCVPYRVIAGLGFFPELKKLCCFFDRFTIIPSNLKLQYLLCNLFRVSLICRMTSSDDVFSMLYLSVKAVKV